MKSIRSRIAGAAVVVGALAITFTQAAGAVPADSISASPSSGPVGSSFVLSGTLSCPAMAPGDNVLLAFIDTTAGPQTRTNLGMTPYLAGNAFSATVTVPSKLAQLILGEGTVEVPVTARSYQISAQCTESTGEPNSVNGTFTVTSAPPTSTTTTTTVSPTTAPPTTAPPTTAPAAFTPPAQPPADAAPFSGQSSAVVTAGNSVDINQGGFAAGETVTVVLYSSPTVLATATADASGTVRTKVTIPAGTSAGSHTLVLFGDSAAKSLKLTVNSAAGAPGPDSDRGLAFTG